MSTETDISAERVMPAAVDGATLRIFTYPRPPFRQDAVVYDGFANHLQGRCMSQLKKLATSPSVAPASSFSDDECVQRLAALIEHRDNTNLSEIVALIARLAVAIE